MYKPRMPVELKGDLEVIDDMIMELIRKRTDLIGEVGLGKALDTRQKGVLNPIYNAEREKDRLVLVREWATIHGLDPDFAGGLLYDIMNESCKIQMKHTQDGTYDRLLDELGDEARWYSHLHANLLTLTAQEAKSYETHYEKASFATKSFLAFEETLINQQVDQLPYAGVALDLGCATGRMTRKLAPKFSKIVGVDLSPVMIEQAREYASKADLGNAVFMDALDLEGEQDWAKDASASFVLMNLGTGSDIVDMDKVMERISRALMPGGRFLLSFYNRDGLMYLWKILPWQSGLRASINIHKNCLDVVSKNGSGQDHVLSVHARAYTVAEVEEMLARHGLSVTTSTYPTISSVVPAELFKQRPEKQDVIEATDRLLQDAGLGAYIIATGSKA